MKKTILFLILILSLINCEDKPEKNFYGIPNDDKDQFIAGLLLSNNARTTTNGTVIDSRTGLEWKKCTQGQIYRANVNDCQGNKNSAAPTVSPEIGRYGAETYSYCDLEGNQCNSLSLPQMLRKEEMIRNKATSALFDACDTDRTGGFNNWRVPTYPELKALSELGKTALLINFPNTPDDFFWTSWGNEQDSTGKTAKAINFTIDRVGEETNLNKTARYYVRCVRNSN